jgi:hypothetical protein
MYVCRMNTDRNKQMLYARPTPQCCVIARVQSRLECKKSLFQGLCDRLQWWYASNPVQNTYKMESHSHRAFLTINL